MTIILTPWEFHARNSHLMMLWPRGEWCILKTGLRTLVLLILAPRKGQGGQEGKMKKDGD